MSEDRKINLIVAAENQASQTFGDIGRDAKKMGESVSSASDQAAREVRKFGEEGQEAGQKLTRSEAGILSSLKRVTEQAQLAARSGESLADAFDIKMQNRGIDASKFAPALTALRDYESALSVAKAREAELVAQNAFAAKAAQANEMAKASQYASWWATELQKVEAAERKLASDATFINSLKAQSDAIGKTRADLLEMQAAQLGLSTQASPFIAKLREADRGLGSMGMTAKATAAAMRGVPAQFQDIVVSLQGGQAPLTVLLQQGSQLSSMFGGAGEAAKALGTYVLGLVNPYTVLAAAVGVVGVAYYMGSKEQDAFNKAIILSGNVSGVTAGQLREYAREIDKIVGTQAQAAAGLAAFTAAGVSGGEELRRYTQTAIEWERATGQSVEKTAEQFASLQKDPLSAVLKLNEGTNFLTLSVYEQIKALEDQGKKTEAAEVAMGALDTAMRERGRAIQENLGYIERAWKGITGAAKDAWDAMLNVGRAATSADTLASVRKELADLQSRSGGGYDDTEGGAATGRPSAQAVARINARIAALKQEETQLVATMQADEKAAAAKAESARVTQAKIEWDKKGAEYLSKSVKMERELAQARNEAAAAGVSGKELEERLSAIREKYAEKTKGGAAAAKALENSYKTLMSTINEKIDATQKETAQGEKLTESQKLRIKYEQELATKGKAYTAQQRVNIEAGLLALATSEKQAEAAKELAKAWEDDAKAYEAMVKKQEAQVAAINSSVSRMRLEEEGHMLAAAAGISHAEAMERITVARLEDALAQAQQGAGSEAEIDRLQRELTARKELLTVLQQRNFREANKKAADEAAKDWDRTAQTISRTLADYIMGGGKDAAQYLKRLFATLVLEPVVQTAVSSVMGGKTGGGVAGAGGLGSLGGGLTNWSSWGGTASDWLFDQGVGASFKGFESLGSSMQSLGVTVGRVDAYLKDIPGMSGGIGSAAGYLGSIYSLSQGQYGSALGSAIGTYIMPGIGTMIGGALGGLLDGFGHKSTGEYGGTGYYSAATGSATTTAGGAYGTGFGGVKGGNEQILSQMAGLSQSIVQSLDATAKAFGQTVGYEVAASFASDFGDEATWGGLKIALQGQSLINWNDNRQTRWAPKEFASGEEGYKQYLNAVALDVKTALQSMDLPGWAGQLISAAGDLDTINAALQQIGTIKTVFDGLGQSMGMFADLGGSVQTTLLNVSGGIETLASNAQSFYANYYSEQERLDATVESLTATFAKYGAQLPATAEQYRTLVEQQMAAGDAGAEFAAVLLGLNGTFKGVADAWKTELGAMSQSVGDFFAGIKDDIASVMADVAGSRKDILRGTGVMTPAEIEAAIGAAMIYSPSTVKVAQAEGASASAAVAVAAAKARADSSAAQYAQRQGGVNAAQSAMDAGNAQKTALQKQAQDLTDWINSLWDGGANSGYNYGKRKKWSDEAVAQLATVNQQISGMGPNLDALNQEVARQQAIAGQAGNAAAVDAQSLAQAQAALAAAQKAELQAKVDYAAQMQKFVADAGSSVSKLSDLRGEVVDFYEAQVQAVQGMLQSAGNLRSVVDQVRLGQLTTAQTAAELGNRYAQDYSMALATTGSARAGYVDSMAGNLQSLSEALKAEAATGADWRVQTAKLLAQASNAAGLLEDDASTDDYKDVSLGLLDSIDKALESLSGTTKSAEQVIADAVNNGAASNLAGLRAIVAALQGQAAPAFASGGVHLGGLRIVGENGPELEATGPSRIWNQNQLAGVLGSRDDAALVAELRALRDENRALSEAMVRQQADMNRLLMRWETQGMPEERVV